MVNAYQLLGVDALSSAVEIQAAYKCRVHELRETAVTNRRALHDLQMARDIIMNASTREVGLHIRFVSP